MTTIEKFLEKAKRLEVDTFRRLPDLRRHHVPFTGTPRKHPHDDDKIILIVDPFSTQTFFYEFNTQDVQGVEVLPSLVNMEGESVTMVRVWVKKGSLALKTTPFVVEDTSREFKKTNPID
jgi:hypothetical protein